MAVPRLRKLVSSKKSVVSIRGSAAQSLVRKAAQALSAFQERPDPKPIAPAFGFCFVKTNLGVLQIDVGWLLLLIGGIVHVGDNVKRKRSSVDVEITEDIIDATVETIRSIPRYIERDLLGMFFEAEAMLKTKGLSNPRLREIGIDGSFTVEKMCKALFARGDKQELVDLKLFGDLLATGDPSLFSIPEITETFLRAISEKGTVGANAWQKFVAQHFRKKHGRGRRRQEIYDNLFKLRTDNPSLSYGKLARAVAKSKNIEFGIAREQVKAAIAYRRKEAARNK